MVVGINLTIKSKGEGASPTVFSKDLPSDSSWMLRRKRKVLSWSLEPKRKVKKMTLQVYWKVLLAAH